MKFENPIFEFFYKDDDLGDPLINDCHITSFGWANEKDIEEMKKIAEALSFFGNGDKQQIQLEVQNILGDVREVQYEFFNADPVLFSQRRLGRTFAVTYRIQL